MGILLGQDVVVDVHSDMEKPRRTLNLKFFGRVIFQVQPVKELGQV